MNLYYECISGLQEELKLQDFRNIDFGDIKEFDLANQTIFPYALIMPRPVTDNGTTYIYTFDIISADVIDYNDENRVSSDDPLKGTSNLQDIYADLLARMMEATKSFRTGEKYDLLYQLNSSIIHDPWREEYENHLAGWLTSISIETNKGDNC